MTGPSENQVADSSPSTKAPSCWLVGGLGCLIMVVFVFGVILYTGYRALQTPAGHRFSGIINKVISASAMMPEAQTKMEAIRQAIIRYDIKNARYPSTLEQLVPVYLTNRSTLHCGLDANADPAHISFDYFEPHVGAPSSAKLLSISWLFDIQLSGKTTVSKQVLWITLGGDFAQEQFENGKLVVSPLGPSS